MSNSHKGAWIVLAIIVVVVLAIAMVYAFSGSAQQSAQTQTAPTQNIEAMYTCDAGKTVDATYVNSTTSTTTGNSVMIVLSDGRQMTLPQTISADGARYSNGNPQIPDGQPGAETFVFWSKGNGAFVTENGTTTYSNCLTQTQ
jgi:membrane-bound inhibitor of C-type lysozyme